MVELELRPTEAQAFLEVREIERLRRRTRGKHRYQNTDTLLFLPHIHSKAGFHFFVESVEGVDGAELFVLPPPFS